MISTEPGVAGVAASITALHHVSEEIDWLRSEEVLARQQRLALVIAVADDSEPRSISFLQSLSTQRLSCPCLAIVPAQASPELLRSSTCADDFIVLPVHPEELRS